MVRTKGGRVKRGSTVGHAILVVLWWGRYEKRRGRVIWYGVVPLWSSGGEGCWVRGEEEEEGDKREMEVGKIGAE